MGNGVGTEGERLEGEGDLAATPKPDKMSEKTPDTAPTPSASKDIAATASSDDAPQKEPDKAAKAVPESGPAPSVKEPEEQTAAAATQPWGELHSMNEELGNFYLASSRVVIGRRRGCTLCLQGPLISGKHCTITRQIYEGGGGQIECYFLLDTR